MRRLALLALLVAPSLPRPSGACSALSDNDGDHVIDATFATDTVPPSAVTASAAVEIDDGSDDDGGGCGTPLV